MTKPVSHTGPVRIGIGGPVGSGKTALMDRLCKAMRDSYDIAAITNDIMEITKTLIQKQIEIKQQRNEFDAILSSLP